MLHRLALTSSSLIALGVLIGCDQTAPLAPSPGSSTVGATAAAGLVPWKESYQTSGTIAPDASCPAPLLLVSLAGGGTATHVGKYTIANSHCVDPATGVMTNGSFLKTAANGDQLVGTYAGTATLIQPPAPIGVFVLTGTLVVTGGTGRFAGATGTASMEGSSRADFSQQPVPTDVTLTMVGEISSPGLAQH